MVSEKRCRKCREVKPHVEFGLNEANKDGLESYCKPCNNEKSKEWRDRNEEYFANYKPQAQKNSERYRENHRELIRAQKLADYHASKNDPEKKAARATYRENNRQMIRDMNNRRNAQLKVDVFNHYGGSCFCCGETDFRFLTLDHKNDDGAAWRKQFASKISGGKLYRVVVELGYPDDFQLACWNCNCGRAQNGGTRPHQLARLTLVASN